MLVSIIIDTQNFDSGNNFAPNSKFFTIDEDCNNKIITNDSTHTQNNNDVSVIICATEDDTDNNNKVTNKQSDDDDISNIAVISFEEENKDTHLISMTKLYPSEINNCTTVMDFTSTNDNNNSSNSGISVRETTSSDFYAKGIKIKCILIQGVELIDFGIRMINEYLDDVDSSAYRRNEDQSIDELSDDNFIKIL